MTSNRKPLLYSAEKHCKACFVLLKRIFNSFYVQQPLYDDACRVWSLVLMLLCHDHCMVRWDGYELVTWLSGTRRLCDGKCVWMCTIELTYIWWKAHANICECLKYSWFFFVVKLAIPVCKNYGLTWLGYNMISSWSHCLQARPRSKLHVCNSIATKFNMLHY